MTERESSDTRSSSLDLKKRWDRIAVQVQGERWESLPESAKKIVRLLVDSEVARARTDLLLRALRKKSKD